jgi:uncharacterized protein YbaP (TraB family)
VSAPLRASSLLWKITGAGGGELYILGSIHVGTPDMYPLNPEIYDAFAGAGRLVVELEDETMENSPGVVRQIMSKGFYPGGETLMSHLNERQRELLEPFLAFLPLGEKSNMKPWLAAVTLDVIMLNKLGYTSSYGVDQHFEELAQERGIPVESLETAEEQLSLFLNLPEADSLLFLESSLIELGEVDDFMGQVVNAWRKGDEGEFSKAFFEAYDRWPKLKPLLDKVIYDRNEVMYERLLAYLESGGTTFAVIGSGHVVTERGIPGLFKAGGYQVEKF